MRDLLDYLLLLLAELLEELFRGLYAGRLLGALGALGGLGLAVGLVLVLVVGVLVLSVAAISGFVGSGVLLLDLNRRDDLARLLELDGLLLSGHCLSGFLAARRQQNV